jgi:hypothetical protein
MPVAHPGRPRPVGHPVRLGRHRNVGHHLPTRQVDSGHRAGIMVGHPQRPAADGQALRAGTGPDRPARDPVGLRVDPGHAVAATPELVTQTAPGVTARSRGARRTVMVATLRPVARSMRVTASSSGASRSPEATLAAHSTPSPTAMASRAQGPEVASRPPRWSRGRSQPPCWRRAPRGSRRPRSCSRRQEGGWLRRTGRGRRQAPLPLCRWAWMAAGSIAGCSWCRRRRSTRLR